MEKSAVEGGEGRRLQRQGVEKRRRGEEGEGGKGGEDEQRDEEGEEEWKRGEIGTEE